MKLLVLSFALSIVTVFAAPASAQNPSDCDFYLRKNTELNCSFSNYLISFGYTYCRKFDQDMHFFSPKAQVALRQIRQCLIDHLQDVNCENAEDVGYQSHVQCYTEHGYCEMKFYDRLQIITTVYKEIFSKRANETFDQIQKICGH